jgi:uncharacterized protein (DUF2252 family)
MSNTPPLVDVESAHRHRTVPRSAHAHWQAPADRADPVQILIDQGASRIQSLLPIRYARMRTDPFAFLRGSAAVMAADLASTATSGLRLQSCGDCHLANFGSYATPEGTPVFDLNDFDETLPAPFEWDIKRLATSLAVAGRVASLADSACRKLARRAARSYRDHMSDLARRPPIEAWSSRVDLAAAIKDIEIPKLRGKIERRLERVLASGTAHFGLIERHDNGLRIREQLQAVHIADERPCAWQAFANYGTSLQEDRRVLLSRYRLTDVAFKVVGVGSVGTFCAIGLFVSPDGAPLLLQVKQAQQSVLAPFAGASEYLNQGQRVVVGQRMMQAATDVFLGWTDAPISGRDFYVRRLKDSRLANVGAAIEEALPFYAELCGRTLARAHARAGDAASVSDYLGEGTAFDEAIGEFALAYADETERDWRRFQHAIKVGRIVVADEAP